jgi:hypothetical protein
LSDAHPNPDHELRALAAEELTAATSLSWHELSRIVPWGDTYAGFAPSGREVEFERSYIWSDSEHHEVLCEVTVRCLPEREDCEARASCLIAKPAS